MEVQVVLESGYGCLLTGQRDVLVQSGKANIDIKNIQGEAQTNVKFGFLEFLLVPHESAFGAIAHVEFRWQDVLIERAELNLNRSIKIRLPIKDFKAPSRLQIGASIKKDIPHFSGHFSEHSLFWATLEDFKFVGNADELGARKFLISGAQSISREIGLGGNYLTDEKALEIENRILNSIQSELPLSVIRLGDGEGRVLGYPDIFSNQEVLTQVLYYHFGPETMHRIKNEIPSTWIQDTMCNLREILVKAVRQADLLGLPIEQFYVGHEAAPTSGMLGYASAMSYGLSLSRDRKINDFTGTNIFQLLAEKGRLFKKAVAISKNIHIVGPWDLRVGLSEALQANITSWVEVPGHYTWRGEKGLGQYPDLYKYVEAQLIKIGNAKGELFLVGAGILGKHYCTLIKEYGGVALDIGSVMDSWAQRGRPDAVQNTRINFDALSKASEMPPK